MFKGRFVKATVLAMTLLVGVSALNPSIAQERQRSGTYTTSSGKSGTFEGTVQKNEDGSRTHNQSWTNQDGETKQRSATGTYDKETGAFTKTVTGANGETRTYTGTAQDGKRSGTYTTSTGKSGTFEGSVEKNEDGSRTRNQSWTNQDGETKQRSVNRKFDRETKTGTRTVTNPQGKTRKATRTFGNQ